MEESVSCMEEIKHELENIKYKEIKDMRNEIQSVKVDLAKNNVLTEQLKETLCAVSSTMESIRDTMIKLNNSNEELTINLRTTNEKMDNIQSSNIEEFKSIKKQISYNEDKTKFDIMLFVKKNFISIVAWGSIICYLFFK